MKKPASKIARTHTHQNKIFASPPLHSTKGSVETPKPALNFRHYIPKGLKPNPETRILTHKPSKHIYHASLPLKLNQGLSNQEL